MKAEIVSGAVAPGVEKHPSERDALAAVRRLLDADPVSATRFKTGNHHFVFDVRLRSGTRVVARTTTSSNRGAMASAATMSRLLRPLGIPLPVLLAEDLESGFPCLILERLAGTDLGFRLQAEPSGDFLAIAAALVDAQERVSRIVFPGPLRYGYAMEPSAAAHPTWLAAIFGSILSARDMIAACGRDTSSCDTLLDLAVRMGDLLVAQPPTPFLHDTTTKNVLVADDGSFSGIVDVDDLCFGDPRKTKALTMAALLSEGLPTGYVDGWLRLSGECADAPFWLMTADSLSWFVVEHARTRNGNVNPPDRLRSDRVECAFRYALGKAEEQFRLRLDAQGS
jgi:hypothetical protein